MHRADRLFSDKEIKDMVQQRAAFIEDNPWVLPAVVGVSLLPLITVIHGINKNRALKRQLQIEREKTRQLQLENGGHHHMMGHHHHMDR